MSFVLSLRTSIRGFSRIALHSCLTACLAASAQQAATTSDVPSIERIHRGDLIEIDELGGFDFDWRGKLNPEGYLDRFEKVADPIHALCKTPDELADIVRKAYSGILRDPRVRVRILDRSDRPPATVSGAVRQAYRFDIRREVGLIELISATGGFTDKAGGEILIFRPFGQSCEPVADESSRTIRLTIEAMLSGDPAANPKIVSGDLVTVQAVLPVYVIGGINRPGKVDWRPGSTVSRAVAAAGGVSDKGVRGSVSIYRQAEGRLPLVIQADLDKVAAGESKDVELEPYDIVDVPFKGSAKRLLPPVVTDGTEGRTETPVLPLRVID